MQLNPYIKAMKDFAFLTESFLITKPLNINISNKRRLCSSMDPFLVFRVALFNIYKIYKRFFIFQGGFEVLKLQYFKLLCQRHIQNLLKHLRWSFLLKAVKSFLKKFILDIRVLSKSLYVTIDCNSTTTGNLLWRIINSQIVNIL